MTKRFLLCTNCDNPVFYTESKTYFNHGDVLIADQWKYIDGPDVDVGDAFFCNGCLDYFIPQIEKIVLEEE